MRTTIKKKTAYKKVNVYPSRVISEINPPIKSTIKNVRMPVANIKKCILAKAKVEEVFVDGSTIELTLKNYDENITPVKRPEIVKAPPVEVEEIVLNEVNEEVEAVEEESVAIEEDVVEEKEELEAIIIGKNNSSSPDDIIEDGLTDEDGLDIIDIGTLL